MTRLLDISVVRKAMDWSAGRDPDVADLIDDVTAELEDLTGLHFLLVTGEELKWKLEPRQKLLVVPCRPLTSVEVVGWAWSDTEPTDYDDALEQDTDYTVDLRLGKVELYESISEQYEWIKVRFAGGYNSTSLPRAVRQAMIAQIQYQSVRENADNIASQTRVVEKSSARLREGDHHPRFKRFIARNRRR